MAEQLKNVYTLEYLSRLSSAIKEQFDSFDEKSFLNFVFDNTWESLELKQRMRHIAKALNKFISLPYKSQLEILKPVSKDFYSFEAMFFQDFVEVYGLDDYESSINALEVFTIESSSEFAIRAFILKYEDETMSQMKVWTKSSNEHLRRLASEGCRPRLPWAIALPNFKKDPTKVLEILEVLKNDNSKYVQKSVANNLNDISKDNPQIVINFVKDNLDFSKDLDWICKHASRTLLKNGDKEILELFGFKADASIEVKNLNLDKSVEIGKELNFSFDLSTKEKTLGNIRLEYFIYFQKANADLTRKIFMISQSYILDKEKSFSKKHSFKLITTRKYYRGLHRLAIVVNGEEKITKEFELF